MKKSREKQRLPLNWGAAVEERKGKRRKGRKGRKGQA